MVHFQSTYPVLAIFLPVISSQTASSFLQILKLLAMNFSPNSIVAFRMLLIRFDGQAMEEVGQIVGYCRTEEVPLAAYCFCLFEF